MRLILLVLCLAVLTAGLISPAAASTQHTVVNDDWLHGTNLHLLGDTTWVLCDGIQWKGHAWDGLVAFNSEHARWWQKPFDLPPEASGDGSLIFGVWDSHLGEGYANPVYWDGQLLGHLPNYDPNGSGPASFVVPASLLTAGTHILRLESSQASPNGNWDDLTFYDISVTYPAPETSGIIALAAGACSMAGVAGRSRRAHRWSR